MKFVWQRRERAGRELRLPRFARNDGKGWSSNDRAVSGNRKLVISSLANKAVGERYSLAGLFIQQAPCCLNMAGFDVSNIPG
jgi:hypothetical protein